VTSPSRILIDGIEYPPLPESVASRIREIIEDEFERDPEIKKIWIAEAERVAAERGGTHLPPVAASGTPQAAPGAADASSEEAAA